MLIRVFNNQRDLTISSRQVKDLANHVVFFEKKLYDEVSIHFVSRRKISKLHEDYFKDPSVTDCVSFPIDLEGNVLEGDYRMMGDVFVCPFVAIENSVLYKNSPYEELSLYVVHGLLHLMGYDDIASEDRKQMREAERRHLKALKAHNLLIKIPTKNPEF
jgi:probable rRNA maturation factor